MLYTLLLYSMDREVERNIIKGFKENMETIAILLNRVLRDGNEEFSIAFTIY